MKPKNRFMTSTLVATAALMFGGSAPLLAGGGKSIGKPSGIVPATVEHIEGSGVSRVKLTEQAAQRIDLKTEAVEVCQGAESNPCVVVPYSALIYDPQGGTWVYTSPEPLSFVRVSVDVEDIQQDRVMLKKGPAAGTTIATVGVAEIYGTEFEVGH